ncbi:MAG: tetratricopeptide repeat protein [Acidobacteriota bacterium]
MKGRLAAVSLALLALAMTESLYAQQIAPRDIWMQATAAAREGDFDLAAKKRSELVAAGRSYGIRSFPAYAAGAAAMAGEPAKDARELEQWATKTARELDARSPAVAFNEADRKARTAGWSGALPQTMQGFLRVFGNYRSRVLTRADLFLVASAAVLVAAIVFALALFIRYGRSLAHDLREMLGRLMSGGSVSVLAFALLFLPLFLWLGPMWLLFYWAAVFFGYAGPAERIAIVLLLVLVALVPIVVDASAHTIAGVDGPVVAAAIASTDQAYHPEALRRLQELLAVVPDDPVLHVLVGNLLSFDGLEEQAAFHYRRAIELQPNNAGAHVNRGNLYFLNNEFQAAINEYQRAEEADPKLATAFYNHSIAAGDLYKFDLQEEMLKRARSADDTFVERIRSEQQPQRIVLYKPPIEQAWAVSERVSKRPAARALFGNYSSFEPMRSATSPLTIGAAASLLLLLLLFFTRRRNGYANACIKCGRTFCHRCKSARESATYCTQCIHIYLKRDGVSLDTKRQKLEEVGDHQAGMTRRNRIFATFLPGSAQLLEGRTVSGLLGLLLFAGFVIMAVLVGRLAPAIGPVAEVAQMLVRVAAIAIAVVLWMTWSLPVYRRRSAV